MKAFVLLLTTTGLASMSFGAALYPECPTVGNNTGCAVLVTIGPGGSTTVNIDSSQGPYDQSDDTLIGVLNNSSSSVGSLPLTGSNIFGFEGDGMCSLKFGAAGNCKQGLTATDPYDYSGDFVTFSNTDADTGAVNFIGGLAPGQSTYFSLEEAPQLITVGPPSPGPSGVPEPATFGLLGGSGLFMYGFAYLRKRIR